MGIIVSDLIVELGGRRIIDGLTASLSQGRITAILGPNGAGKTTLLRSMLHLLPASNGSIKLDSQLISTLPPRDRARRMGYLPQDTSLAWNIRVSDIVALGRAPWRSPFAALSSTDHEAIEAALDATDSRVLAERLTGTLSGGERARVMLARVLAGQPDWLFVDEPLASLDPAHQVDISARLRGIADAGHGIVIVLHDLTHAAAMADDILLLKAGKLVAAGSKDDVLTSVNLRRTYDIDFEIVPTGRGPAILPRRAPA